MELSETKEDLSYIPEEVKTRVKELFEEKFDTEEESKSRLADVNNQIKGLAKEMKIKPTVLNKAYAEYKAKINDIHTMNAKDTLLELVFPDGDIH